MFFTSSAAQYLIKKKYDHLLKAINNTEILYQDSDRQCYIIMLKEVAKLLSSDLPLLKLLSTSLYFVNDDDDTWEEGCHVIEHCQKLTFNDLLQIASQISLIEELYQSQINVLKPIKNRRVRFMNKIYSLFLYIGLLSVLAIVLTFLGSTIASSLIGNPATLFFVTGLIYKILLSAITVCGGGVAFAWLGSVGCKYYGDQQLSAINNKLEYVKTSKKGAEDMLKKYSLLDLSELRNEFNKLDDSLSHINQLKKIVVDNNDEDTEREDTDLSTVRNDNSAPANPGFFTENSGYWGLQLLSRTLNFLGF